MKLTITAKAPTRITFCGGGSDISPIPEKYGGACCNATINKYITSRLEYRKDNKIVLHNSRSNKNLTANLKNIPEVNRNIETPFDIQLTVINHFLPNIKFGFDLFLFSDPEVHSGLGTSAAVFTSLISVFNEALELKLTKKEIAETAFKLETEKLGHMSGRQDQYASVFGGLNFINFHGNDNVDVKPINVTKKIIMELQESLMLFFLTPRGNISNRIINDKINHFKHENNALDAVLKAKNFAINANQALMEGNIKSFAMLLDENWKEKQKFSPLVSNSFINSFYEEIKNAGALGGKILGAGGGGHMLFISEPKNKITIIKKALELGARHISFSLEPNGVVVWES